MIRRCPYINSNSGAGFPSRNLVALLQRWIKDEDWTTEWVEVR
jgi:hypothetical protein